MTKFKILSKKKQTKKCTATKNSEKERVKSQHKVPRPTAESNRKDRGPPQLRVKRAQRPPWRDAHVWQYYRLFNDSWKTGKTPDSWHEATIIPLLKPNKPKNDPASYRPVSLTSTFTKLMQKMIKPRLCNYLEKNNLLSKYQSGCRLRHSCEDNLTRLESDIGRAQKNKHFLLAIFLDLTAAFDKMWISGAIIYLRKIGIKGRILNWLKGFLEK